VECLASNLIELSTRENFALWLTIGSLLRGWARSALSESAEGISSIEQAIRDFRATGTLLDLQYFLALKAEALHLANRTSEALEAIREAEKVVERSEQHQWSAELRRLRGVFLASMGADEMRIETSFCAAIRTAKEQKSISLAKRAEASYAEYRRQKASTPGECRFRLPL
jgi:predicted ATPase